MFNWPSLIVLGRKLSRGAFCSALCQFWNIPANFGRNGAELTSMKLIP